ncbi:MAG: HWE histidine kinase domain-containing protein [Erythrobacter sp.]
MVYKFHPDESGEVIAENRREDLEPYLGLRYPRADIPQQARALFIRNRFWVIADMSAKPVPIEPRIGIDNAPLDLSMSMLRSHSEMHVQYMRNMGVGASLAISIVRQGRLWGMISCHHYQPRLPAYSLRTVAELLSQMFSLMLDRILIERSETVRSKGRKLHEQLMQRLTGGTTLDRSLTMLDELLDEVIEHDGVSTLIGGEYSARGNAPSEVEFMALTPALGTAPVSTLVETTALYDIIPEAAPLKDRIAGALIVPISRSPRDYIALWRRPLRQKVVWAGDPEKALAEPGERLQPRGRFAAWEEDINDRSEDWSADELQIAEGLRVTLLEVILRMTDEAARERKRSQEKQDLLIAELNHRVRNILNLIRSLVSQAQHDAMDVSSFASIIGGRISSLASAHDNITRENWAPAPLSRLFETELAAYLTGKEERFELTGDQVLVTPEGYTVLALVVHEMVTNSAKYGSLCDRAGSVSVHISRNTFGDVMIAWREQGGPHVKPPTRRGFGSTIIERSIPFELKGEASLQFKLLGLEADFLIPSSYIVAVDTHGDTPRTKHNDTGLSGTAGNDNASAATQAVPASRLPAHMILVEDSMIIALDTEENLKRLGVASIDVASSVSGALAAMTKRLPDFAIIDFNLGPESSTPVAEKLRELSVPFVLATGYADLGDQGDQLGAMATLRKPYGRAEIEDALEGYANMIAGPNPGDSEGDNHAETVSANGPAE